MKKGLRIYLYKRSILHAKYAIIDNKWATIGSTNLDYLSLIHNREGNLITTDSKLVNKLTEHFMNDMKASKEITPAYWGRVTIGYRIVGSMAKMIRKFV